MKITELNQFPFYPNQFQILLSEIKRKPYENHSTKNLEAIPMPGKRRFSCI